VPVCPYWLPAKGSQRPSSLTVPDDVRGIKKLLHDQRLVMSGMYNNLVT